MRNRLLKPTPWAAESPEPQNPTDPLACDLTFHARSRSQQRGITTVAIELIMRYGEERPISHGAYAHYMTPRARHEILHSPDRDAYRRISDRMDCYVVADVNGHILTVARPEPGRFRRRDAKRTTRHSRQRNIPERHFTD